MKRTLSTIISITAATTAMILPMSCAPSKIRQTVEPGATASTASSAAEPGVDTYERHLSADRLTFLDTLNRGKELGLAADDLMTLEVAHARLAPAAAGGEDGQRFRIQILASSRADMVRREKMKASSATDLPVSMSSEQSLFKLYVGDFGTREEAEAALPGVRGRGYSDAWIVTTK